MESAWSVVIEAAARPGTPRSVADAVAGAAPNFSGPIADERGPSPRRSAAARNMRRRRPTS